MNPQLPVPNRSAYDELYAYTMTRGLDAFVLQHVVDAFAAQTGTDSTKPITLTFALVGLYLHVEKGYSGRQVQRVHMQLGQYKREWPAIPLPLQRGQMTPEDVLTFSAGAARDAAISEWCRSVWEGFRDSHVTIAALLREHQVW
jgi:hypothetical protein